MLECPISHEYGGYKVGLVDVALRIGGADLDGTVLHSKREG
jgi:hypothetical protein